MLYNWYIINVKVIVTFSGFFRIKHVHISSLLVMVIRLYLSLEILIGYTFKLSFASA